MSTPTGDGPTLEQMQTALEAATAALTSANRRISELESQPAAEPAAASRVTTHYVHLANGTVVEQDGAIPTHVDLGDENNPQRVPVVAAFVKE